MLSWLPGLAADRLADGRLADGRLACTHTPGVLTGCLPPPPSPPSGGVRCHRSTSRSALRRMTTWTGRPSSAAWARVRQPLQPAWWSSFDLVRIDRNTKTPRSHLPAAPGIPLATTPHRAPAAAFGTTEKELLAHIYNAMDESNAGASGACQGTPGPGAPARARLVQGRLPGHAWSRGACQGTPGSGAPARARLVQGRLPGHAWFRGACRACRQAHSFAAPHVSAVCWD